MRPERPYRACQWNSAVPPRTVGKWRVALRCGSASSFADSGVTLVGHRGASPPASFHSLVAASKPASFSATPEMWPPSRDRSSSTPGPKSRLGNASLRLRHSSAAVPHDRNAARCLSAIAPAWTSRLRLSTRSVRSSIVSFGSSSSNRIAIRSESHSPLDGNPTAIPPITTQSIRGSPSRPGNSCSSHAKRRSRSAGSRSSVQRARLVTVRRKSDSSFALPRSKSSATSKSEHSGKQRISWIPRCISSSGWATRSWTN